MSSRPSALVAAVLALSACGDPASSPSAGGTSSGGASAGGTSSGGSGGAIQGPALTAIDPPLGDVLGGSRVTVQGSRLSDVAITLGGAPCEDLTVIDDTAVRCRAPALTAGTWDVAATSAAGTATLPGGYESWSPALIEGAWLFQSDAGTVTSASGPVPTWLMVSGSSPWRPRDGAGLVEAFGRLWLLGGWDPAGPAEWSGQATTNEVWASDDGGISWSQVLAHDPAPPEQGPSARWTPRHTAGFLRHQTGGVDYLYVVGGDIYNGGVPDVWRSADGAAWERVIAAAPWGPRVLQMVAEYKGALYVLGGQIDVSDPATCLADVWRSADGGFTWEQLPDAPWAPRGMVETPVEHDGALWLLGGGTYDDGPRTYYNDVWRFDGQWTEVSPDGAAPWSPREYHNVFSWQGELWVASGYEADDKNHDDVWHSPDGVTWTELPAKAFAPGHADGVAVTAKGPVHASGNAFDSEVFALRTISAGPLLEWHDRGARAAVLKPSGAQVTWVEEAFGALPGIQLLGRDPLRLAAWESLPGGLSAFWIGATLRSRLYTDGVNAAQTVIGDSLGSCRAQVGYGGDQAELVVTDASGSWAEGQVLRGNALTDGAAHLVGFTFSSDGVARAYVDGAEAGDSWSGTYDADYMGWDSVGAGYGGDSGAYVTLGAVLVLPSVLSAEDRTRLASWSRKWQSP